MPRRQKSEIVLEASSKAPGVGLRMIFQWTNDRWTHRLAIVCGETETTLLTSIEGDMEMKNPPSPPLQDADQHEMPGGAAVLAVGMAGTRHWSASFSVEQGTRLFADLACLSKGSPDADGGVMSSYQVEPDVRVAANGVGVSLTLENMSGQNVVLIEPVQESESSSKLQIEGDRLLIAPKKLSDENRKATRWGYRFLWQEN